MIDAVSLTKALKQYRQKTYWYCKHCHTLYVNDIYWYGECYCPKDYYAMQFVDSYKEAEKFLKKHTGK